MLLTWLEKLKLRFSIRTRFFVLFFLLTLLPFFAYKFVVDLHHILLSNQVIIQKQTVINLSYILENRTDLWSRQILAGGPTNHLDHLDLNESAIWFVNEFGQANYIVGKLPKGDFSPTGFFPKLGAWMVISFAKFAPFSLPYPYPQSAQPEIALVRQALKGETYQQYRLDKENRPISIMSATPIRIKNKIIGAIILEEGIGSLLADSLQKFYKIIGISSIIFLFVIISAIGYIANLSNRIIRLDKDVEKTFTQIGKIEISQFPDRIQRGYHDEISDLRHHIYQMLSQLGSYERYLKQLPKTLRHEIHNPLNRLATALDLMEKDINHKQLQHSKHALEQLKKIISSMSEATSIEDSLSQNTKETFCITEMLNYYFESLVSLNEGVTFDIQNRTSQTLEISGDGFMVEQMLDKVISNAKDFALSGTAIEISYQTKGKNLSICVRNQGQSLPKGYERQIFDGMTSIREVNQDDQPHLGLGLYIVKLIAEFHHGNVFAQNWHKRDKSGVKFIIELPVLKTSVSNEKTT